jgi:peptide/nickel transport system permease protein
VESTEQNIEGRHRAPLELWIRATFLTLGSIIVTMLGLMFVTFVIGRVMPIDPVLAIVGEQATKATYDAAYEQLGLDRPIIVQFIFYVWDVIHGDFGKSLLTARPVAEDIKRVFPATLELATIGLFIGIVLGVPLGVFAAVRRGSWIDQVARVIALVTGMILIDSILDQNWEVFKDALNHIVLPASLLGYYSLAYVSRMTRSFMLEQLSAEYITTARVKGMSESAVIWSHAFKNIRVQLITVIALSYANLLEGSVLTEIIFSWPGIGSYITTALLSADMSAVMGGTVVVGLIFILLNIFSDLLYKIFDPRAK